MLFAVKMIRMSSTDQVELCAWGAAGELGISREEADRFIKEALLDQKKNSPWPEGFMA